MAATTPVEGQSESRLPLVDYNEDKEAKPQTIAQELCREAAVSQAVLRQSRTKDLIDRAAAGEATEQLPSSQLAEDAYGVGIMCITQGFDVLNGATTHVGRVEGVFVMCFGIGTLLVNGCMQLFLIVYTRKYVLGGLAKDMGDMYDDYHNKVFEDGEFSEELWAQWPRESQKTLCEFPLSVPTFFFTILLLWTLVIAGDLRACSRLAYDVFCLHDADTQGGLVLSFDGKHVISRMRRAPRLCIFIFAVLPKMCIALITWWYGCRWLTSTPLFADLILNSCALGFITSVDEVLYAAVMPEFVRLQLQRTAIFSARLEAEKIERAWKEVYLVGYFAAVAYFATGVVATYLYIFRLQRVLPQFNWDVTDHCMDHRHW